MDIALELLAAKAKKGGSGAKAGGQAETRRQGEGHQAENGQAEGGQGRAGRQIELTLAKKSTHQATKKPERPLPDPRGGSRLHRRHPGQRRQARDRARLRHQGRRPDPAEGAAQGPCRGRRRRQAARQADPLRRPAAGDRARGDRPRPRRRTHRRAGGWLEEQGTPPQILVRPWSRQGPDGRRPATAILARLSQEARRRRLRLYRADHQAAGARSRRRCSASVRETPGGPQLEPVDRKQKALAIERDGLKGAKEGDLVSVTVSRSGRYGLDRARVTEVIGSMKNEKAVSLIAILSHGIPHVFPTEVLDGGRRGEAGDDEEPRGLARPAARHHRSRPTPRIMTTPSMPRPTTIRTTRAASSSPSRSPTSPPMSRRARRSTARR